MADFSEGFKRLAALGMPPLDSKAKWSTLPGGGFSDDNDYYTQNALRTLKGNGWLIPGADGKNQTLPAAGIEATPLDSENSAPSPRRGLMGRALGGGSSPKKGAAIPEADPTKDIATLIKHLIKEKSERNSYSDSSSGVIAGKLLLLATQFHQTGQSKLANELAQAVFDYCPSREIAIDSAISTLADHSYKATTEEFFKSGDWAAYYKSLSGLITKYPRGWASQQAVAIFLPQIAKQVSGEKPPTPSLPGITLDPRALAAIQKLCEPPAKESSGSDDAAFLKSRGIDISDIPVQYRARYIASLRSGRGGFSHTESIWLLVPPADSKEPKETKESTPTSEITALKTAALPALAALIDDPFLTHTPNPQAGRGRSYFSSSEGESERTQQLYQSLNRPATRGEIAEMLLKSTLPESDNGSSREMDSETLRESALEFWKAHQNATREELAAVFLREGSMSQSQNAAEILATSTDPKAHQALEAHILESDPAIAKFQIVQTYLRSRKAAAKPFLESYAKLVRSQTAAAPTGDDDNNPYEYQIKQAGGPEKVLKQLDTLVTEKPPRAIAQEIAKGDPKDAEASIRTLFETMKDVPPMKRLYAMLEGAVAAEDPLIRYLFLEHCRYSRERDEGEEPDSKPKPDRTLPEAEIKVWRKLIADTRKLPKETREKSTLGDIAASAMELSINLESYQSIHQAAPILRKKPEELIRERAIARLDGKPLPVLPDASRITPERLRAIITEAGAKPALEIHPYLNTLTPDERAAWQNWCGNPGDIPAPQSVKDLSRLVVSRGDAGPYGFSDVKGAGIIDIGFALSSTNFKSYIESIAKDATKHSRTLIYIQTADFGPGLEVCAHVFPLSPKKSKEEFDERTYQPQASDFFRESIKTLGEQESAEAFIQIDLPDESGRRSNSAWLIEKGRTKPLDPEQQTTFDAAMKAIADSSDIDRISFRIQILTRADADKIQKLEEEAEAKNEEEEEEEGSNILPQLPIE